jgi:hypothetical protein
MARIKPAYLRGLHGQEALFMRRACRSVPVLLILGIALAGCSNKGGDSDLKSGFDSTKPNQVVCKMDGIV